MQQTVCRGLISIVMTSALGAATACSSGAGSPAPGSAGELTGEITAAITSVPTGVRCIVLTVSGPSVYGQQTRTDVVPNQPATIHVGQLDRGYYSIAGTAWNEPCSQVPYYYPGEPVFGDAGDAALSWIADQQEVLVYPGAPTSVTLYFHQLGSLSVGVDFGNCDDPSSYAYYEFCSDGGFLVDAGVYQDAGVALPPYAAASGSPQ